MRVAQGVGQVEVGLENEMPLHVRRVLIYTPMGWLRLVGLIKSYVSFAKEPYKTDNILQKRPNILRSLLIAATPYEQTYAPNEQTQSHFTRAPEQTQNHFFRG